MPEQRPLMQEMEAQEIFFRHHRPWQYHDDEGRLIYGELLDKEGNLIADNISKENAKALIILAENWYYSH